MSFKSGVKGRGSDRWWERRWWLWWGDVRRMRWTRRTVNRMRLTEWRRKLILSRKCGIKLSVIVYKLYGGYKLW